METPTRKMPNFFYLRWLTLGAPRTIHGHTDSADGFTRVKTYRGTWATGERSGSDPAITMPGRVIMLAGIGDHDRTEFMITMRRNELSRSCEVGTSKMPLTRPSSVR